MFWRILVGLIIPRQIRFKLWQKIDHTINTDFITNYKIGPGRSIN